MYFEEYGNRELPTIIMLHGAGMVHSFVNQYILSDRFNLVLPHLYGNGRESEVIYRSEETLDGIIQIIKSLNKPKVSIIGFSLGAQLIIPLISKYEQLFDKAIMASPWVLKSKQTVKYYSLLASMMYPLGKVRFLIKFQSKLLGLNDKQLDESIEYNRSTRKENPAAFITDGVNIHDYPEFKNVKIPMLALSGEKESADMIKSVKYLGGMNPCCKVEIWEKFMHEIPFKNPERFNKTTIDFLG